MTSEISSAFQKISVYHSLPLYNFTQWKDKCASYSFNTKKLTYSMCQVSLIVKYSYLVVDSYLLMANFTNSKYSNKRMWNVTLYLALLNAVNKKIGTTQTLEINFNDLFYIC